jgi:Rieske 2Fe-2S protein
MGGSDEIGIRTADYELTCVEPGSPMGELLRRYWQPACTSDELRDLPKKVKLLCEELVVFRDKKGRVGALDPHCSHRGTSSWSACGSALDPWRLTRCRWVSRHPEAAGSDHHSCFRRLSVFSRAGLALERQAAAVGPLHPLPTQRRG